MYLIRSFVVYFAIHFFSGMAFGQRIKTTVGAWNKKTTYAIQHLMTESTSSWEKKRYEGKLIDFRTYSRPIEKSSSYRSMLLTAIGSNIPNDINDFYVIEANESGESVRLNTFLIYPRGNNLTQVKKLTFIQNRWILDRSDILKKIKLDSNLSNYRVKFDSGFHHEDVIISRFVNGKIVDSQFYLYGTLSAASGLGQILKF